MWSSVLARVRVYAPYIVLPFAMLAGFVGYKVEGWASDKHTPYRGSVMERREERHEKEAAGETKEFKIPGTIFERNKTEGTKKMN